MPFTNQARLGLKSSLPPNNRPNGYRKMNRIGRISKARVHKNTMGCKSHKASPIKQTG